MDSYAERSLQDHPYKLLATTDRARPGKVHCVPSIVHRLQGGMPLH